MRKKKEEIPTEVEQVAEELPLETHPFPPFVPENANILIMGTFPPGTHRWSMEFYYPNKTNDFWKVRASFSMTIPMRSMISQPVLSSWKR